MASPRTQGLTALKGVARHTIKYPRLTCGYPWTQLDNDIEVFGDANFAGFHSTRKSTVGGVAMWSGQFVKAWSKTMRVLVLSSGECELAAVVRAATEGMGLQSILSDVDLCGHVAIECNRSNRECPPARIGEKSDIRLLETGGCNTMLVQGKFEFPKCRGWRIRAMRKPSILDQNHYYAMRMRVIGYLSMQDCNRSQKLDNKA